MYVEITCSTIHDCAFNNWLQFDHNYYKPSSAAAVDGAGSIAVTSEH
jgi:hypothetical protein